MGSLSQLFSRRFCSDIRIVSAKPRHQFSTKGDHIYFTAGDVARVKIFVLPVPLTPKDSTANPGLSSYATPVELVGSAASSDIQPLGDNRLLFTQSSFTSPNDVFVLEGLKALEVELDGNREASFKGSVKQVTKFTEEALKGKQLAEGEDFWFKGAEGKDVQGFILKPKGWKQGETKKWPVLLLIHGGRRHMTTGGCYVDSTDTGAIARPTECMGGPSGLISCFVCSLLI